MMEQLDARVRARRCSFVFTYARAIAIGFVAIDLRSLAKGGAMHQVGARCRASIFTWFDGSAEPCHFRSDDREGANSTTTPHRKLFASRHESARGRSSAEMLRTFK
jgi:hypothetical protein